MSIVVASQGILHGLSWMGQYAVPNGMLFVPSFDANRHDAQSRISSAQSQRSKRSGGPCHTPAEWEIVTIVSHCQWS